MQAQCENDKNVISGSTFCWDWACKLQAFRSQRAYFMTLRTHSFFVLALAVAGFSAPTVAQTDHSSHGSPAAKPTPTSTAMAMEEAIVKKIDKPAGKVALAHGAQKDGMPAMTMVYRVKDAAQLDRLKEGQKIRFSTDPADSMNLLRIEPVK